MDTPSDDIYIARSEGFITRTRINDVTSSSPEKYQKTLDTGTQIISFDREYAYSWSIFENDDRCEILDTRKHGKVCKWPRVATVMPMENDAI